MYTRRAHAASEAWTTSSSRRSGDSAGTAGSDFGLLELKKLSVGAVKLMDESLEVTLDASSEGDGMDEDDGGAGGSVVSELAGAFCGLSASAESFWRNRWRSASNLTWA